MILATVSTRNFDFAALGTDERHAVEILVQAWTRHCDAYGADVDMMQAMVDDGEVNYAEIAPGVVLRDGEPL